MSKKIIVLLIILIPLILSAQVTYSVRGVGKYHAYGLSADTKPVNPPAECMFTETNTGNVYKSLGGSWVLISVASTSNESHFVNIKSFGADTNSSDNRAAIIAARDYIYSNSGYPLTMYIPKGTYQVSDSIKFDKGIKILGEGTIGQPASELGFPEGKRGLIFSYINGQNGFGADVENLKITGQITPGYNNTSAHAITIRTRVKFVNVHISQADGNGFYVSACGTQPNGDNNNYGNADESIFLSCAANYCTNGFFSEGCDAHIMDIKGCNFSQNRRWGYYGNALAGDLLTNCHFAFNGVAVPGANSVVTYNSVYYVAKEGYDGYYSDAADSNYNKQPDTNPNYWREVTPTMVSTAWSNSTRYYSGGPAIVRGANAWTKFDQCYTEGGQPPLILNSRSRWEYGTNGATVVGGIVKNTLYGEDHTYNGGMEVEKYLMVGTTTYDPSTIFKVYNDHSVSESRIVFKGEGTTSEVYLDLKNNTGKYARFAYVDTSLKIYVKNDSLGLTINDVGVTAKKFFGDGSGLTGLSGSGDMLAANNLSDVANVNTARTNLGLNTTANQTSSTDKNYVTDAQLTVIGNTLGTNTGDNAVNSNYSSDYRAANFVAGTNYLAPNGDGSSLTGLTKTQVGLSNADNTSDASKPVSTAQATAIAARGYALNVQALTGSPTDAQTVYFGQLPKAPTSTANISKIYIRKSGTIKIAQIYAYAGTAGTGEAWSLYIRLNNTTDNLIATVSAATSERIFTNSSLSIAVVAGDYIEIKSVNPTWATNPLTLIYGGYIYIE